MTHRIREGFAKLLSDLREPEDLDKIRRQIKSNTAAIEAAEARVKAEYENAGIEPPKDLRFSLSLTARRDMQQRDAGK